MAMKEEQVLLNEGDFNKLFVTIEYYIHRYTSPEWKLTNGHVQWTEINYVVCGSAEYTVDGVRYKVRKGDLLCTQKDTIRSFSTYPDDLMECYCVSGPVFDASFIEIPLPFPFLSHVGVHQDILSMYRNLDSTWVAREPGYELKARGIYMMILQRFLELVFFGEKTKNYNIRVRKAIKYIIEHYSEDLSVQAVAGKVGLSASYFGNIFRKETGASFHQFLTKIRLNRAEDILKSGECNVSEVAWACGFSDPFYFSKVYKENSGISPSQVLSLSTSNEM
jgi:AraC-like DNA-binding protein